MADLETKITWLWKQVCCYFIPKEMPEQRMGSQIFSSILFFLLTPLSNTVHHVPPGKIHSIACGITDNLKEVCQHLWHHNGLPSNHTLLNVFCSVPQNKMYQSVNLGRIISQSADNLPDSASCILKSAHTEESQGTQPRQPGGGDSSTTDHRWKGMMLSIHCTPGTEDGQCWTGCWIPGLLQPLWLLQSCFIIPQQWAQGPTFPLESPPLPSWSHAMNMPDRPARIMEVQEEESHHLCFTVKE